MSLIRDPEVMRRFGFDPEDPDHTPNYVLRDTMHKAAPALISDQFKRLGKGSRGAWLAVWGSIGELRDANLRIGLLLALEAAQPGDPVPEPPEWFRQWQAEDAEAREEYQGYVREAREEKARSAADLAAVAAKARESLRGRAPAWYSTGRCRQWWYLNGDTVTVSGEVRRISDESAVYFAGQTGETAEVAMIKGVKCGVCIVCGLALSDPISKSRGVGPDCWRQHRGLLVRMGMVGTEEDR